jgi:hypothetical protein
MMDPKYVKRRYFASAQPGSYSALDGFFRNSKYKDKAKVEEALMELYSFNVHRPVKRRFLRRPVVCVTKDWLWQSDLIDYRKYKRQNHGMAYILLCVDCFTKKLFCVPLKSKNSASV